MEAIPVSRETIDFHFARSEDGVAKGLLSSLFNAKPTLATASYVATRLLRSALPRTPFRVAFLRTYTVEPMVPLLRARALLYGIDLTIHLGEFNAYVQELLDGGNSLYAFAPDVVVVAAQAEMVLPDVWQRATTLAPEQLALQVDEALAQLSTCVASFRSRSTAHLLLHTLDRPVSPNAGVLEGEGATGQLALIARYNDGLREIAATHRGVHILDFAGVAAAHGRSRFYDRTKWLTTRMPFAHDALLALADEHMRYLVPLAGSGCKVLVLDLDNTLWGGVVGEDGTFGVRIGTEYPGAAYLELQRAALDLRQRGILLAIASKNNLADAVEVFEKRPEMLLKLSHFASVQIHWGDKAQSLRAIADELNVGLDTLAFADDNPVEREFIRLSLKEVHVLDLPQDPMGYAAAIRNSPVFERLTVSAEDRDRSRLYSEQRQRDVVRNSATSLEDYYLSLDMVVTVSAVCPANVARIAQLTQKTNQFNLTTERKSEAAIEELANRPDTQVLAFSVTDRFGDNGLVAVAITRMVEERLEIDNLLMSCRVIGRTLETAFLAHIVDGARKRGALAIDGRYVPSKKNMPASEFYPSHGFEKISGTAEAGLFRLDLAKQDVPSPSWVRTEVV